jgi:hypothetical protein
MPNPSRMGSTPSKPGWVRANSNMRRAASE